MMWQEWIETSDIVNAANRYAVETFGLGTMKIAMALPPSGELS